MKKTLLLMAATLLAGTAAQAQSDIFVWQAGQASKLEKADSITFTAPANFQTYAKKGLVITEIFYGSYPKRSSGNFVNYKYDQYFKIGNNSDHTLYLDGVLLGETMTETDLKWDISPAIDSMQTVLAQGLYQFPGDGTTYPVEPGKEIVVALCARNHKLSAQRVGELPSWTRDSVYQHNADSLLINLGNADFEAYDQPAPDVDPYETQDVDNPDVTNLDKWYNSSATLWVVSQQGNLCYFLAVPDDTTTKEGFLENNLFKFSYSRDFYGEKLTTNNQRAYIIPAGWIIDGVNVAHTDEPVGNFLPSTIDAGWTYIGAFSLNTRRDKAIVRKLVDGKWADTNNSTNDFTPATNPTLR